MLNNEVVSARLPSVGPNLLEEIELNMVLLLYPQKLALTSPTGGGRSVGMVRSRTKATEFSLLLLYVVKVLCCKSEGSCFDS